VLKWSSSSLYKKLYELPQPVVLWKSDSEQAVKEGILWHKILSFIYTDKDLEWAINQVDEEEVHHSGLTLEKIRFILSEIIDNSELRTYYTGNIKVFNERGLMDENAQIHIPDRMVELPGGEWVVIDYKTGSYDSAHRKQVEKYTALLRQAGKRVKESLLVYLSGDGIKIVKVSNE
jgi:CRISPR/Cas system-associated exonuclease Cas4 (RecB family)